MMGPLKFVKKLEKMRMEPLEFVEKRVKKMLKRWKKEFPDYRVEEIVVDMKLGGKLFSWNAGLLVTLKKKDSTWMRETERKPD